MKSRSGDRQIGPINEHSVPARDFRTLIGLQTTRLYISTETTMRNSPVDFPLSHFRRRVASTPT